MIKNLLRNFIFVSFTFGCLISLFPMNSCQAADAILPMDRYFPIYTAEYVSIPNVQELTQQWNKSDLGRLFAQDSMKPFRDSIQTQFNESMSRLRSRLGITLDDLQNIVHGEVGFGIIYPNKELASMSLIANITDHANEAQQLTNKIAAQTLKNGGKVAKQKVGTADFVICDILDNNGRFQKVVYVLDDPFFIISDNIRIAMLLMQKVENKPEAAASKMLAQNAYYQMVYRRCLEKSKIHDILIFAQLDRYIEASRILAKKLATNSLETESPLIKMTAAGFDAIKSIGAAIEFKHGDFDRSYRAYVYAPKPWTKSMLMLNLPNTPCPEPPLWASTDMATYFSVNMVPTSIFENMGPMFDTYFAEGEQGVWNDVLEGLEKDEYGPQINLQKDLVDYLTGRIIFVSQAFEPFKEDSEKLAYALEISNEKAIRDAVARLLKDDPDIKPAKCGTYDIWQYTAPQKKQSTMNMPTLSRKPQVKKPEPVMAHAAVAIEKGYLIIASSPEFLKVILDDTGAKALKNDPGYKNTTAVLQKLNGNSAAVWNYANTAVSMNMNYELFKQGKLPESRSLFGRLMNNIIKPDANSPTRSPRIDAKALPDYSEAKPYFGKSALSVQSDENGFLIEGFILPTGI